MTTAKQQQMAGQPDSADDLIAELAKLMAQDAHGETSATKPQPAGTSGAPVPAEPFSFRIPGAAAAATQPVATPFPDDAATPVPTQIAARLETPVAQPNQPDKPLVSPDADHNVGTFVPPVAIAPEPVEHDSIADLIAAELRGDTAPSIAPPPKPVTQPMATPRSAAEQPRPSQSNSQATTPGGPQQVSTSLPTPRAEVDSFKIAPVFGLGTTPVSSAPPRATVSAETVRPQAFVRAKPDRPMAPSPAGDPQSSNDDAIGTDPIDEIESLIGRAVRVELDQRPDSAVASPALRSLATPTIPTQPLAANRPAGRAMSGVDEAILAAAAATGAEVGWVQPSSAPAPVQKPVKVKRAKPERAPRSPSSGFSRQLVGPLVAVALLLVAGLGLYWALGLSRDEGPAPLLTADATPVKEEPAVVADAATPQQSVVFNEIDGVVPGADEQLVSRDQADVNEVTQVSAIPDLSAEGLANRKVRTVTVRPDGTIVSGDESLAGSAILPVDRPNVPETGAAVPETSLLANAAAQTALAATNPATPTTVVPEPTTPVVAAAEPGSTVPVVDATGAVVAGKTTVIPLERPTFSAAAIAAATAAAPAPVNAVIDTSVTAAQPQAAVAPPAGTAPAYVQLSSQRTEDAARQVATDLAGRFGPVFGGASLQVQRVDLGARGIYYRVLVPAATTQSAGQMCSTIKANGGDCFIL